MSNSGESRRSLGQWLQQLGGLITGVTGFVTVLVGFVQLVKGNAGLVTLILLGLGIGLVWLACFYFARFWQPEKQDEAPKIILPASTDKQVKLQQQEEAIAAYDASLKLQPDDPGSYFNIARCYALLNKPAQSLDNLENFLKLDPETDRETIESSDDFKSLRDQPRFKALMDTN
jgi:tetratricopeptide (TPR) repeat protein